MNHDFTREFEVHIEPHSKVFVGRSLEQWNRYRREWWAAKLDKVQHPERYMNGLRCPKCDYISLYDTGQQISSAPNVLRVKCANYGCNFRSERFE